MQLGDRVKAYTVAGASRMVEGLARGFCARGTMVVQVGGDDRVSHFVVCHVQASRVIPLSADDTVMLGDVVRTVGVDVSDDASAHVEGEVLAIEPENQAGVIVLKTRSGVVRGFLVGLTIVHRRVSHNRRYWELYANRLLAS